MKQKQGKLLVVDDNRNVLSTVRLLMSDVFETVECIANPANTPSSLRSLQPDVVLLDMNFGRGINNGNEGLYWLRQIKQQQPQVRVVLFTAYADIDLAVTGLKEGAVDFVVKPFDNAKMIATLRDAYANGPHSTKAEGQKGGAETAPYWGDSETMRQLLLKVEKVAATDANILITGENGTGKEVLAREIHRLSQRSKAQFEPIDMGAITETLFESELFGYMKGAFTDAKADHAGRFEQAEGGTLFLDEIGNLSYPLQAKLLTALQRRSIVRVGGSRQIPIDVRLICATNRDLAEMVRQGEFREDLLYRINTIHLHLPPLRERQADIVPLAERFLRQYSAQYNKVGMTYCSAAREKLQRLPWYGNIRELQHAVEKAVILADSTTITEADIEGDAPVATESQAAEAQTLEEMERQMIAKTIRDCNGNLSQVASRLDISRQTLYNKIKKYGL